jgi:hypothetical protein
MPENCVSTTPHPNEFCRVLQNNNLKYFKHIQKPHAVTIFHPFVFMAFTCTKSASTKGEKKFAVLQEI